MPSRTRHVGSRSAVGMLAAAALLFGMLATPASASYAPDDTEIKGALKGGELVIQGDPDDVVFPLGEKEGNGDPTVCVKEDVQRSNFRADVDDQGNVSNFTFVFNQATTGITGTDPVPFEVCAELVVKNTQLIEAVIDDKEVQIDPGPEVEVIFIVKDSFFGIPLEECAINVDTGPHGGAFGPPTPIDGKEPHDWDLSHSTKEKFNIPAINATGQPLCSGMTAAAINAALGLPSQGSADFFWAVYDCGAYPQPDFCYKP